MSPDVKIFPGLVIVPSSSTPADRSIEKRRLRKHAILNVIRSTGPLSRADLSKISGYNVRSVSNLVDELVGDGLVKELEAVEIPRGRRPIPVILNEKAGCVLGIDIGRHRTIGRLMDLGATVIHEEVLKTPSISQSAKFIDWALKVAETVFQKAGDSIPPLCGIGVGLPGAIWTSGNYSLYNVSETARQIKEEFYRVYGVATLVDNDARMMAHGTLWFGRGNEYPNFAVLKMGVQLGLGLVMNKTVVCGANGGSMELGRIPLATPGVKSMWGGEACLDDVASGSGIERMARERGLGHLSVAEIADAAREGNEEAKEVFALFAQHLGLAIATVINLFHPYAVILSGRLSRAADLFFDEAKAATAKHVLPTVFEKTDIILSDPNARLGSLGAVAIVFDHIFNAGHVRLDEVL